MQRIRFGVREASQGIWRKNPIVLPLTVVAALGSVAFFVYLLYIDLTVVQPQYVPFPPPVAEALRSAIYYTEVSLNPPKALNAYKEAMRLAEEFKMDPMSDEVLGIRIQVAYMLEKSGLIKPAIEVLERIRPEARAYIDKMAPVKPLQKLEDFEVLRGRPDPIPVDLPEIKEFSDEMVNVKFRVFRQRTSVLRKLVGIELKLAELYGSGHIRNQEKMEACLVSSMETCLKEMQHRQKIGLPIGGAAADYDQWLTLGEIAVILREPADMYYHQHKDDLALPLYLRALDLIRADEGDTPTCKQVVLLTCVAAAMSSMVMSPRPGTNPIMDRNQTMETAKQWALKALQLSDNIKSSVKDINCDEYCIGAALNLGEMEEFLGRLDEAEKYFKQAKKGAHDVDFQPVVAQADAGLARLATRRSGEKDS